MAIDFYSDPRQAGASAPEGVGYKPYEAPAAISSKNYDVVGYGDQAMLKGYGLGVQGRRGVQADRTQADAALQSALQTNDRLNRLGRGYERIAQGRETSATDIGRRMAMDQAIAAQYAGGGSGANQYLAGIQGTQGMSGLGAQYGAARAQEIAAAQQGMMGAYGASRGGSLATMGQSQDFAMQQAQLDAAQRARNDEMTRYYLGQMNQLELDQLMANQAYEAQVGDAVTRFRAQQQAKDQADTERYERRILGGANAVTGGAYGALT